VPPKPRRGCLRSDPLAAVIPDPAATSAPPVAQVESAPAQAPSSTLAPSSDQQAPVVEQLAAAKAPTPEKSVKFNGYVSLDHADHADHARDALYLLPGEWTTGRFLEHAIDLALADLE